MILIVASATGGHIYPAIALGQELKDESIHATLSHPNP